MSREMGPSPTETQGPEIYDLGSREAVKDELEAKMRELRGQLMGLQNSPFKEKQIKEELAFLEEQRKLISLNESGTKKAA